MGTLRDISNEQYYIVNQSREQKLHKPQLTLDMVIDLKDKINKFVLING